MSYPRWYTPKARWVYRDSTPSMGWFVAAGIWLFVMWLVL